jgi:hypothetical protein
MTWTVLLEDNFAEELLALDEALQDEVLAHAKVLAQFGPGLGRPTVPSLRGPQAVAIHVPQIATLVSLR